MVCVIGIKSVNRFMAQNYYNILGISKNASDKDIKSAYRRMARKLHPDVNPDDSSAQKQFKKVNEAYEVVGDPSRRKDYDHFGDNWKHADQIRNVNAGHSSSGGIGFNLGDLFGTGRGGAIFAVCTRLRPQIGAADRRGETAASCGDGEAGDLSLHVRWAFAFGDG